MKLPLLDLQSAIFKRLYRNISCEVYSDPTQNTKQEYPFVSFNIVTLTDNGTLTDNRTESTFQVDVFSKGDNDINVKKILNEVVEQITKEQFVLKSFVVEKLLLDTVNVFEEIEDKINSTKQKTYHAYVIFRIKLIEI